LAGKVNERIEFVNGADLAVHKKAGKLLGMAFQVTGRKGRVCIGKKTFTKGVNKKNPGQYITNRDFSFRLGQSIIFQALRAL
jgi:hypothetical protein